MRGQREFRPFESPLESSSTMSKKTGVHWNPKIPPYPEHNDRTDTRSKNIHQELTHKNEYSCSAKVVRAETNRLYQEAMQKQAGKKGKKTPRERSIHEAIFEIDEKTTMLECQELAKEIEKLTGFQTLQIAIHRDEGHTDEQGNFIPHYHAHAVFFTLDKDTGKQLARQQASLNKANLSKMQDLASKIFDMERGQEYFKNGVESPKRIQNQDDFKRYKDQERELLKEIANERTEIALKFKKKEKEIQDKAKELKSLENDLNRKIELAKKNANELLEESNRNFFRRKNSFKGLVANVVTFGKHFKELEKQREAEKLKIVAIQTEADTQARKDLRALELQMQNLAQEKARFFERIKELKQELEKKEQSLNEQKEYTQRAYKERDQYAEILKKYANDELLENKAPKLKRERDREIQQAQEPKREFYGGR